MSKIFLTHCLLSLVPVQSRRAPLYKASQNGRIDVVKALLSKEAAVDKADQVHCQATAIWLSVMHMHLSQQSGSQGI